MYYYLYVCTQLVVGSGSRFRWLEVDPSCHLSLSMPTDDTVAHLAHVMPEWRRSDAGVLSMYDQLA